MPMDFEISEGQLQDIKMAPKLVGRNSMKALIADKAYASRNFRLMLAKRGIEACIPRNLTKKKIQRPMIWSYIKSAM